jgi:hypothetical protein
VHTRPPHLQDVLAGVRRGRVAYLCLTREQKMALRDPEARIALDVLRHLLGARPTTPERFPLTEATFQAVARKLGHQVGIKRSRALLRRLRGEGVLDDAGSYPQPYRNRGGAGGFRVRLYRLAVAVSAALNRKRLSAARASSSPLQRMRWWQHPLFGDYEGRPPPHWTRRRRQQTASLDEYAPGVLLRPTVAHHEDGAGRKDQTVLGRRTHLLTTS